MTRSEFTGQFIRLCTGFRYEPTTEQSEAWYRRVQGTALSVWAEAITTLLCARYFPKIDDMRAAIERHAEDARRAAVQADQIAARRTMTRIESEDTDPGGIPTPGTALWSCIQLYAAREQVRQQSRVRLTDVDLSVDQRTQQSAVPGQRETDLTRQIVEQIPALRPDDVRRLLTRYER